MPIQQFQPRLVVRFLLTVFGFLLFANLVALYFKFILGHDTVYGLVKLFNFGAERNVPTLFSTCLFLIAASLFFIFNKANKLSGLRQPAWLFLAFLFCFLAIDEFTSIHERISRPMHNIIEPTGLFYYTWVIPYGIAVGIIAVFVLPTFYRLQYKVRNWFAFSAAIYLLGAIGFEMLGGMYFEMSNEKGNIFVGLLTTIEETLEMLGLIVLIYALLLLIENKYGKFGLQISDKSVESITAASNLSR